jgi:mono/diheme cytochrome c family protein
MISQNKLASCLRITLTMSVYLMSISLVKAQYKPWIAPKSADAVKNPIKPDARSISEGKKIYVTYCVPCHGNKGKGDGVAAAALKPKPADHSSQKVQSQTDGAIFYKITTGRLPMAPYKDILNTTQRWQLVNYIRTLAALKK